jgi:hypothetical protein
MMTPLMYCAENGSTKTCNRPGRRRGRLPPRILDEEAVLEAAAPAGLHADAQTADRGIDPFLLHELHDLGPRDRGDGHEYFG